MARKALKKHEFVAKKRKPATSQALLINILQADY
jgi:hypothetical protein